MTSFSAIWKDAGVLRATPPFLVVPWDGIGLVYLNGVRSHDVRHHLTYDRHKLDVEVVAPSTVSRHLMTFAQNFPAREFGAVLGLVGGVRNSMQFGSALLSIEGNAPGETTSLAYIGKAGSARLDVYTAERRTVSVSFRFVSYLNEAGEMKAGTVHRPAYAQELMAVMNRLYLPSANIELKLRSATAVNVQRRLGPQLGEANFRDHIVPLRDSGADMTVFFVGKYKGTTDPLGEAWHDVNCIVVDDAPWQYIAPQRDWPRPGFTDDEIYYDKLNRPKSDRDLHIVLAHEIAHLLGVGHNNDEDNIMSSGRQDLSLNRRVVTSISRG